MRIIKNEKITVADGTEKEIILSNGGQGDTTTGELYIQTLASVPFTAEGYVRADEDAVSIPVINCADYSITTSPSAAGLYMAMATPYEKVNLTFAGAGDVVIKTVF